MLAGPCFDAKLSVTALSVDGTLQDISGRASFLSSRIGTKLMLGPWGDDTFEAVAAVADADQVVLMGPLSKVNASVAHRSTVFSMTRPYSEMLLAPFELIAQQGAATVSVITPSWARAQAEGRGAFGELSAEQTPQDCLVVSDWDRSTPGAAAFMYLQYYLVRTHARPESAAASAAAAILLKAVQEANSTNPQAVAEALASLQALYGLRFAMKYLTPAAPVGVARRREPLAYPKRPGRLVRPPFHGSCQRETRVLRIFR
eukprot:g27089.t1